MYCGNFLTPPDELIAVLYLMNVFLTRVRNTGDHGGVSPGVTRGPPFCPFVPQAGTIRSSDNSLVTVDFRSREQ